MFLFLILCAYLPLIFYLPFSVSILFILISIGGTIWAENYLSSMKRIIKYLLLGLSLSLVLTLYGINILGREPGVSLLSLMIGVKTWELRDNRDRCVLLFLANFIALSSALFSQSLGLGIYLFFYVLFFLVVLQREYLSSFFTRNILISSSSLISSSFSILFPALPLSLIIFVLFPRLSGSIFGIRSPGGEAVSGISSVIKAGEFSSLVLSNRVAFRVKFKRKIPVSRLKDLYWRCAVFYRETNDTWTFIRTRVGDISYSPNLMCRGNCMSYQLFLLPQANSFVPFLDPGYLHPLSNGIKFQLNQGYFYTFIRRPVSIIQYQGTGCTRCILKGNLRDIKLGLQIDRKDNPRAQKLVSYMKKKASSPTAFISEVILFFKTKGFSYTLYPTPWPKKNGLDFFLFHSKSGFCEHYAIAMAMLLRYASIPSRIVAGYIGGEMNPMGKYIIVRDRDAHAWIEAYLGKNRGWVRIDPTRYLSLSEVKKEVEEVGERKPFFYIPSRFIVPLRFFWDYLNYQWMLWMVSYNQEEQLSFLKKIHVGEGITQLLQRGIFLMLLALFITLGMVFIFNHKVDRGESEIAMYYRKFLKKMCQKGAKVDLWMGPREVLDEINKRLPHLYSRAEEVVSLFVEMMFQGKISSDRMKNFKKKVRRL